MSFRLARLSSLAIRRALFSSSSDSNVTKKPQKIAIVCDSPANCKTALRQVLEKPEEVSIDELTVNGKPALRATIGARDEESVGLLLRHRASPGLPRIEGDAEWPILHASRFGLINIVRMLISAGANVNTKYSKGSTPLLAAIDGDHLDVVEALIAAGARVEGADQPPLISAATRGRLAIVRTLLRAGADPRARFMGLTATVLGSCAADNSDEIIKALIEYGIGHDDLIHAVSMTVRENRTAAVRCLLANGVDVNARDVNGHPLLLGALAVKSFDVARMLIAAGADVNASSQTLTALAICASGDGDGFTDIVPLLLERKAQLETCERNGATALIRAAQHGRLGIVRHLIAAGANVDHAELDGGTSLMLASQAGHVDVMRALLDARANVNAIGPQNGITALLLASQLGQVEPVQLLLDRGALPRAARPGDCSPLQMASLRGFLSVVRVLLSRGADVNEPGELEVMSLGLAAGKGHADVTTELLSAGANVNQRASDGASPVMMAAYFGHARIVLELIEAGADITLRRESGETALDLATQNGHAETIMILKQAAKQS
jgi:ankyrin repeat protein